MTQHKKSHHIKWHDHHITSHYMTWHVATNHITSPQLTSQPTTLLHLTPQPTSWHQNRSHHHHGTSPPWNGWTLARTKNSVWALHWFVSLRTFYRQILSLLYSSFPSKLPPPARPGTTCKYHIFSIISSFFTFLFHLFWIIINDLYLSSLSFLIFSYLYPSWSSLLFIDVHVLGCGAARHSSANHQMSCFICFVIYTHTLTLTLELYDYMKGRSIHCAMPFARKIPGFIQNGAEVEDVFASTTSLIFWIFQIFQCCFRISSFRIFDLLVLKLAAKIH